MDAAAKAERGSSSGWAQRVDWGGASTWLLGFGLVGYLGLESGGYDLLVGGRVGIAVWWVLLVAVAVGAIPLRRPQPLAWAALVLLACFVAWTALGLTWTESVERTSAELARVATYLGVFGLALLARSDRGGRRMVAAVGTAVASLAVLALLSRLHPAWFPQARETAEFLQGSANRLSYPIDYWNGLAALIAIGAPAILQVATSAKTAAARALAAAALPAMALAAYLTLSRAGLLALAIGLAVFLAFAPERLPRLATLLATALGGGLLIGLCTQRDALQDGLLTSTAESQGDQMLVITIVVCVCVGLAQLAITRGLRRGVRPPSISRRQAATAWGIGVAAALVVALALGAPGRVDDAWQEFKSERGPEQGSSRLTGFAGESRYQFWRAAVDEAGSAPLTGTGPGTFVYWWARNGDAATVVQDTHSLYLQTLGEAGVVGLLLVVALLAVILVGGGRETLRASARSRPQLAAALGGAAAFCFAAGFDWLWQIPVLPVAFFLLASVLVGSGGHRAHRPLLPPAARVGICLAAVLALVAIAVPLASTAYVRQSQDEVREGDLAAALSSARSAANVEPGAATPRLQQALVLEEAGDLAAARREAAAAVDREETNWRTWLVLSRLEAKLGRPEAAVRDYREARSLNPRSPLFAQ